MLSLLFKILTIILLMGYFLNIWITVHMCNDVSNMWFGILCRFVGIIIFPIGGIQGFFNE